MPRGMGYGKTVKTSKPGGKAKKPAAPKKPKKRK